MKRLTSQLWAALLCLTGSGLAVAVDGTPAQLLHSRYASLQERLRENPFHRPLVLESAQASNLITGDIHAVLSFPFATVSTALNNPDHWCDVISLHANTKYCRVVSAGPATVLRVNVGKKTPQDLKDAPRIEFQYGLKEASADYLDIELRAKDGPLGTSDYRLALEAVPLPPSRTFLHLTYSYMSGFAAQWAMQAYLATVGRDKVGFTLAETSAPGAPEYIGGVRAAVERNTMRYYLAIDSFLSSADTTSQAPLDARLQTWFSAVEEYPRQLHEMERDAYLVMKRAEHARQQEVD